MVDEFKIIYLVYDTWDYNKQSPLQSNCKDLYNNSFHMSIDSPLTSIFYPMDYVKRLPINDIEKYPDENLFYFVTLMPNLIKDKLNNNQNPIPTEVINSLKKYKNFNILFMNEQESEDYETFMLIHYWSILLGINQKQIWIINNNTELDRYKYRLNSKINIHTTSILPNFITISMKNKMGEMIFKPEKEFLFMCHNRRPRAHRYCLLCILKKYNILDSIDWSLINGSELQEQESIPGFYSDIFTQEDINYYSDEMNFFNSIQKKKSKYEEEYDWFDSEDKLANIDWMNAYEKKTFENSYFNITTESQFDQKLIHISEKSFKSFYAMQFPLILASPNHISEIRNRYDFDFFDDVIDHNYDKIINNRDRLFTFANEIKRIYDNRDFFIDFYKKNEYRFIKNNIRALEYANNNSDLEFLKKLPIINKFI